jgi:hypothetical protein
MRRLFLVVVILTVSAAPLAMAETPRGVVSGGTRPSGVLTRFSAPDRPRNYLSALPVTDKGVDRLRDQDNGPCSAKWGKARLRRNGCLGTAAADAAATVKSAEDANRKTSPQN